MKNYVVGLPINDPICNKEMALILEKMTFYDYDELVSFVKDDNPNADKVVIWDDVQKFLDEINAGKHCRQKFMFYFVHSRN